jgi:Domain of unknown function (DUF4384)
MKPLAIMAAFAGVLSAQDAGLKARELFYAPPTDAAKPAHNNVKPTRAAATKQTTTPVTTETTKSPMVNVINSNVPLGMRYSVLKRDASGSFKEVDSDATFHSGDRIRLHVDANTAGYLYVVSQGSSGNWSLLFPSADVDGGNNRIEKGSSQQIPASSKGQFVFNDQSGTEKLFLVLSRKPEPDLDKLIYSITGAHGTDRSVMAQATINDDVVNRLRDQVKSRDLVFEKVDGEAAADKPAEKATYVVNPNRTDDARLVVDVALKHGK